MGDDDFNPSRAKGEKIGNYRIVRLIGRGGMSEVYLGQGLVAEKRFVAIKVLARRFQNRPDLRKRLERESEIYDALNHPNIVRLYDVGMLDDGTIYLIMELVRGRTLREHIALRRMDLTGALHVMIQVTAAMCFAHRKDVVHRDLKPDNVMVTQSADVKVLDFGIAKFIQGGTDSREMPRLGTIAFLSPEQINKEPVDGRSDIYAMGLIFYIALSGGRHPYESDGEETTDAEMIARHLHARPRPLRELLDNPDDCPEAAWAIIAKCLEKRPEDRYATMDDLLEDLTELIRASVPPNHPVAQRAMEEQEIKRVSGVAFAAGREEVPAQRATAELINFTPPTWVTPFEREALPPPAPAQQAHTPLPAVTEAARALPVAPLVVTAVGSSLPSLSPSTQVAPSAPATPAPLSGGPAFAPARSELTPSSSEADAARRGGVKSAPLQVLAPPPSAQPRAASERTVIAVGLATGLVVAAFVAALPAFRATLRAVPGNGPGSAPDAGAVIAPTVDGGGPALSSGAPNAGSATAPPVEPAPVAVTAEPRPAAAPPSATAASSPGAAATSPPAPPSAVASAVPSAPRARATPAAPASSAARKGPPPRDAKANPDPPKAAGHRIFGTED